MDNVDSEVCMVWKHILLSQLWPCQYTVKDFDMMYPSGMFFLYSGISVIRFYLFHRIGSSKQCAIIPLQAIGRA